jgi:hypothetical protein
MWEIICWLLNVPHGTWYFVRILSDIIFLRITMESLLETQSNNAEHIHLALKKSYHLLLCSIDRELDWSAVPFSCINPLGEIRQGIPADWRLEAHSFRALDRRTWN